MNRRQFSLIAPACLIAAAATKKPAAPSPGPGTGVLIGRFVGGPQRSAKNRVRDAFRHPLASLEFWGLKPGLTVVEIEPSGGYWTEILAPYLAATRGRYVAALGDEDTEFRTRYSDPKIWGHVETTPFTPQSGPLVANGTADLVLTARNFHNWMWRPGLTEKYLADFHAALKPQAILALEEHRADPRPMVPEARDGYVSTAYLTGAVEGAGFALEASSEINANPLDTKDHPFGVWTLPPTRRTHDRGQPTPDGFDPAKYEAIGESDRMTLRFRRV